MHSRFLSITRAARSCSEPLWLAAHLVQCGDGMFSRILKVSYALSGSELSYGQKS